jgi:hypothetical protein
MPCLDSGVALKESVCYSLHTVLHHQFQRDSASWVGRIVRLNEISSPRARDRLALWRMRCLRPSRFVLPYCPLPLSPRSPSFMQHTAADLSSIYIRDVHNAAREPRTAHARHWCGSLKILLIVFCFNNNVFYFILFHSTNTNYSSLSV